MSNRGFSLIELMIAITILGILTSITLVNYKNHIKKTVISNGLYEISSLKAEYEMAVNENYSSIGNLSSIKLDSSKYCTLKVNTSDDSALKVQKALVCNFKNTMLLQVNAQIYLTRSRTGQYHCYAQNIEQKYLPKPCTAK